MFITLSIIEPINRHWWFISNFFNEHAKNACRSSAEKQTLQSPLANSRPSCLPGGHALYAFAKINSHNKEYDCMSRFSPGPWHVEEEKGSYGVFSNDALLAVTLSDDLKDKDAAKANAHLMASAPLLLEVIKQIKEHLDNNMIVTEEGLKINDRHLRDSIIDAILRAEGYRI
jgi:hypothetical protein